MEAPRYEKLLAEIKPAYEDVKMQANLRMDSLIKPLGSLGKLETVAVNIAGITGKLYNNMEKCVTIVFAADNGICEEGVSCSPQEITLIQSVNMKKGLTGIGTLSRHGRSDLLVVDVGIKGDFIFDGIINEKIMHGTNNFSKGPAMSKKQAEKAIDVGIKMADSCAAEGYNIIGTGEMGIGNTSSSSAVAMVLTGASTEETVGKGGGLTDEAYDKKKRTLQKSISINMPDKNDPVDTIAKVGGLDIAGLVGCYIGAAYHRIPIVVDGVISAVAALVAVRLNPNIKDFLIASHSSKEPAYAIIAKELNLCPMLDLDMRLGEGTGCALAYPIISAACYVMNHMATFDEIKFDETYRIDIR